MDKGTIVNSLKNNGIIAIIRTKNEEQARKSVETLVDSGIKSIEITFSVPNVLNIIREYNKKYFNDEIIIGAGTVSNETTATLAIMAGAKFIVSPFFDKKIAKQANFYQIPYLPGATTPLEVKQALEFGSEIIKLFPASELSTGILRSLKGPIPQAILMPTGGVSLDNAKNWVLAGAKIIAVGGDLTCWGKEENWEMMKVTAQKYLKLFD